MPQKITMNLNNNNSSAQYLALLGQKQTIATPQPKSSSLKTPMIGRIHNVRPGCGSCGRG